MDRITNQTIEHRAARIVDLRNRLALESDRDRSDELRSKIEIERFRLAVLLAGQFRVTRDDRGTLRMFLGDEPVPANSAYLDHLLSNSRMTVRPGQSVSVATSFAVDVIDEALGAVNHMLAVSQDLRRQLNRFLRIALSLRDKACA